LKIKEQKYKNTVKKISEIYRK